MLIQLVVCNFFRPVLLRTKSNRSWSGSLLSRLGRGQKEGSSGEEAGQADQGGGRRKVGGEGAR
ncbi:hypothetical protein J2X20_000433 [Pelomonas saccharophila]|uniref:Uncharacterized protein n=1 Tax=Roseateles saccharophilus TaxID=304 RepID=A0ABU1YG17_ROSSA|nr:hypothetical protein [Roseateles saccharophilus]MDR7267804.1 hypothetical protein [Roseateles saccharophilus]